MTKSGDFNLGIRNRITRSDTRHRVRVVKSQASVREIPGSTPDIKTPDFIIIAMSLQTTQLRV